MNVFRQRDIKPPLIAIAFMMTNFCQVCTAWEGFTWDEWRTITGVTAPDIHSPQSGETELLPLLQSEGMASLRIDSIQGWESKRDRIMEVFRQLMGESNDLKIPTPEAETLGEEVLGSYTRVHLRIRTESDDWIPAYFLVPKTVSDRPMPAVIVLHQTVPQGKEEPCGMKGSPEMAFAQELAERGTICLVPDAIGFGERTPAGADPYTGALDFYRKHPQWSFFGKMVWDVQRLVDFLYAQPQVDSYRIGCMGHSHGAYGSLVATVFEPRITAVVASCGYTTLRTDPHPNRWSHLTALLPRLGFYLEDIKSAPFDWHELTACIAPRPYWNWATLEDTIFPETENLNWIYKQIEEVYALYGAVDNFQGSLGPGPHEFPKDVRLRVYDWLGRKIPPRAPLDVLRATPPGKKTEWESRRDEIIEPMLHDIGDIEPPSLPTQFEIVQEQQKDAFNERKIQYAVAEGETISAYLLIPNNGESKKPAVIVFHQTTAEGKEEAVGHTGRASIHFGPELAKRGYVVLAPDSICAGERITASGEFDTRDFYQGHPNDSAMAKMIRDGRRAIDMLQAMPEVDGRRIGAIGHSLGAEEALFVAAFDKRILASAASCGYAPFRDEANCMRWCRDRWFSYMPRLRIDLRAGRLPAWDFDDAIRLIAPRGFFNYQTTEDEIFPEGDSAHAYTLACRPIWNLYDKGENLQSILESGPHDISAEAKEKVYRWMDRLLDNKPER